VTWRSSSRRTSREEWVQWGRQHHERAKPNEMGRKTAPGKFITTPGSTPATATRGWKRSGKNVEHLRLEGRQASTLAEGTPGSRGYKCTTRRYGSRGPAQNIGITNIHVHKGPDDLPLTRRLATSPRRSRRRRLTDPEIQSPAVGLPRTRTSGFMATRSTTSHAGPAVRHRRRCTRRRSSRQGHGRAAVWAARTR